MLALNLLLFAIFSQINARIIEEQEKTGVKLLNLKYI